MMLVMMLVLGLLGLVLLLGGPAIARLVLQRSGDPVGLGRVLQVAGIVLLVTALLLRSSHPETTAFPPPPAAARGTGR